MRYKMASERNISVCTCVKSAARRSYADLIGAEGKHVLQVLASETAPAGLRDLPAGETLRQVWEQHYLLREDRLRLRIAAESAGLGCAWVCPMIPRLTQATNARWIGRVTSVYLTETCNEELPHPITAVQTTVPDISDAALTEPIQRQLAAKELLPQEHLVDSGYADDDRVVRSEQERGVALIGPVGRGLVFGSR